jgi:hypothetical protein
MADWFLHPFSKLRDLPEKYSYFKCQFYVTKTAKTRSYYRKENAASPPRDQRQHAQFAE